MLVVFASFANTNIAAIMSTLADVRTPKLPYRPSANEIAGNTELGMNLTHRVQAAV
jgi:hypothetical protein